MKYFDINISQANHIVELDFFLSLSVCGNVILSVFLPSSPPTGPEWVLTHQQHLQYISLHI